jgi:hypothetical protein
MVINLLLNYVLGLFLAALVGSRELDESAHIGE